MEKLTRQQIHNATHPYQKVVHGTATVVTVFILLTIVFFSFHRDEFRQNIEQNFVASHRASDDSTMMSSVSDEDILAHFLTDEEKKLLGYFDFLYWPIIFVPVIGVFLILLVMIGKQYSQLLSQGIRINKNQYPEVYAMFEEMVEAAGLTEKPELYLMNGNGVMNAFAACIPGYRKRMVAIYSDIFDVCIEHNDLETLRFVIGHEIGHHAIGHTNFWYMFFRFFLNIPPMNYIFGKSLTRSQEYGADKIGALLSRDKDGKALTILATGKNNYFTYSFADYYENQVRNRSIVTAIENFTVDHPVISWRISALRNQRHGEIYLPLKKER